VHRRVVLLGCSHVDSNDYPSKLYVTRCVKCVLSDRVQYNEVTTHVFVLGYTMRRSSYPGQISRSGRRQYSLSPKYFDVLRARGYRMIASRSSPICAKTQEAPAFQQPTHFYKRVCASVRFSVITYRCLFAEAPFVCPGIAKQKPI
jgi:hypothetical protein